MAQAWIWRHKINGVPLISSYILLGSLVSTSNAQQPGGMTTATMTSASPVSTFASSFLTIHTSLQPNSTSSSTTSRKTADTRPSLFGSANASTQYDPNEERNEKAFNYYFLILGGIVVAVALGLWWIRRRKRRQKEQMRLSGQNALARDLDGWANSRRWIQGTWRQNQNATNTRHEEGLNEQGEAPPPYQPKSEISETQDVLGENVLETRSIRDSATGLTIPMHTLSRDELDRFRPPAYQASSGSGFYVNPRSSTAGTVTEQGVFRTEPSTHELSRTNETRS